MNSNFSNSQKGLSPIIATILLVFVAVGIVTALLNWGEEYTVSELDRANSVLKNNKKSSLGEFVKPHRYINEKLTIENLHSSDDVKITGYMIHDDNPNNYPFLNTVMPLSTNFKIKANTDVNSGDLSQIDLICTPSRVFKVSLITNKGEYIDFDVTSNDYDSSSCADAYQAWDWNYMDADTNIGTMGKIIQQTSDGGFVIVGNKYNVVVGTGTGGSSNVPSLFITKLDKKGNLDWNLSFGDNENVSDDYDEGYDIVQTSTGDYVAIGFTKSYDSGSGGTMCLLKVDSSGNQDWNYLSILSGSYLGRSVLESSSGDYYTCGYRTSSGQSIVSKFSSDGVLDWNKFYDLSGTNNCYDMVEVNDGLVFTGLIINGSYRGFISKIDFDGNTIWTKDEFAYTFDRINSTQDGGFILENYSDFVKTDSLGNVEWSAPKIVYQTYAGDGVALQTVNGNYITALESQVPDLGYQMAIAKYNSAGVLDWNKHIGDNNHQSIIDVFQTYDGGYVFAGRVYNERDVTAGTGMVNMSLYVLKTDANGNTRHS